MDVVIEPMDDEQRKKFECSSWWQDLTPLGPQACHEPAVVWIKTRYSSSACCASERCAARLIGASTR